MKIIRLLPMLALLLGGRTVVAQTPAYLDDSLPIEQRVEDALARMTLEEKVALCHGQSKFCVAGVKRLGIPELWMNDGPHGMKADIHWDSWEYAKATNDSCTAFPALVGLAATWNPELSLRYGRALGEEARYRKKDVVLGPGVNICRTPLNGRSFEYMGEDPYLAAQMVVPYIQGVQQNGVATCVKHFAVNNQEADRLKTDVVVSDRALYEIYLPAFRAAVQQGGTWSIMGSYNRFEGTHCSHNDRLLNKILKGEWGFDGVVVSDWGGTHDTREAALNGLDIEMGTHAESYAQNYLADPFLALLKKGEIPQRVVDEKARRVLRLILRTSMNRARPWGSFATEEHAAEARAIAEEGIVLLKNEGGLLPLETKKMRIAVIGENADKRMSEGGGSAELKVWREITPLAGIRARFPEAEIVYERGYVSGYKGVTQAVGGQHARAVEAARKADLVIYVGGLNKERGQDSEQADRSDLYLPYNQDRLIEDIAAANKNTVVVLLTGNAVAMPWIDRVRSVAVAWYGGSEAGNALAAVLSGDVNPSGKLPVSFPVRLEDLGAHSPLAGEYPGDGTTVRYNDDIFVGYRWLEKQAVRPLFCFGHGLSYTTFAYGKPRVDVSTLRPDGRIVLSIDVTNTGARAGAEVVQLYVGDREASVPRPVKELKGFRKVSLAPGETRTVEFVVTPEALSFYDAERHAWKAEAGQFDLSVGSSSADIRRSVAIRYEE